MGTISFICIALVTIAVVDGFSLRRSQKVSVAGRLVCNSDPKRAGNVQIKLVDVDRMGIDDEMGETRSAADGTFTISGKANEMTDIDPVLKIYHDCGDTLAGQNIPGQLKKKITIPDKYINEGVFQLGDLNLEAQYGSSSDSRDILH